MLPLPSNIKEKRRDCEYDARSILMIICDKINFGQQVLNTSLLVFILKLETTALSITPNELYPDSSVTDIRDVVGKF
jgi:hypothetical protein